MFSKFQQRAELLPLFRLHLLENRAGVRLRKVAEEIGRGIGTHFFHDVRGAVGVERFENRDLRAAVELLEGAGRDLFVERLEHGLALRRGKVLDDVRDVGWMERGEALIRDLQLHAAGGIALDEVHEMPRNRARRNPREQRAKRVPWDDALCETPQRAPRPDVDRADRKQEPVVLGMRVELEVIDTDDLPSLHVDNLLIEQIPLEQQQPFSREGSGFHAS